MPTAYYRDADELRADLRGTLAVAPDGLVTVRDEVRLRATVIDRLIWTAVFHPGAALRDTARRLIQETAPAAGVFSTSIQPLYAAAGRGECSGFTVPAINARTVTYDLVRTAYRVGHRINAGPLIFEIARSEMGYAQEPPAEYGPTVLAAAIKEGVRGPVFIQGDHFQVNAARYSKEPDAELAALRTLIDESLAAGFRNIDLDSSTLVDLSLDTLLEQQHANAWVAAELTAYIRSKEPREATISVGGEIGEVGKKNTTVDELRAYMKVYLRELQARGAQPGISKISVQTGTSHGGVVGPDGKVAEVALDFGTLKAISETARRDYGLAGAVQHGASTLPDDLFHRFPQVGTAEIHLATGFQNLILDSPDFPQDLWQDMAAWLREHCAGERLPHDTDAQFFYRTRKKTLGPFKEQLWSLPDGQRRAILEQLEAKFAFIFTQLGIADTAGLTAELIPAPARTPASLEIRQLLEGASVR